MRDKILFVMRKTIKKLQNHEMFQACHVLFLIILHIFHLQITFFVKRTLLHLQFFKINILPQYCIRFLYICCHLVYISCLLTLSYCFLVIITFKLIPYLHFYFDFHFITSKVAFRRIR